jgi:hypothetical protein
MLRAFALIVGLLLVGQAAAPPVAAEPGSDSVVVRAGGKNFPVKPGGLSPTDSLTTGPLGDAPAGAFQFYTVVCTPKAGWIYDSNGIKSLSPGSDKNLANNYARDDVQEAPSPSPSEWGGGRGRGKSSVYRANFGVGT